MIFWVAVGVAVWIICGIVDLGLYNAWLIRKCPELGKDLRKMFYRIAIVMNVIAAPLSVVLTFIFTGFGKYGWTLKQE